MSSRTGDSKKIAQELSAERNGHANGANDGTNGKTTQNVPTHPELRERWQRLYPHRAHGLGEWRVYDSGIWTAVPETSVKQEVMGVLEVSQDEGVRVTASLLASVAELARVETFVRDEAWDADPDILVCRNGTLHISSKDLQPHAPGHYATSAVPYDYDPDARAPMWEMVLKATIPDAADFLQEFAGYALTTDTSHELAIWLSGPMGSGKSTILAGLQAMLGERAGVLGLADVERNRFALADLPGKTLVVATEQPAGYVAASDVINAIISGEPIQVERKYRDAYTLTPRAKIAWAMNELPRVPSADNGLFRRVKVINFPALAVDQRDPEVKQQIVQEGAGILNWALEGLRRLQARGHFEIPKTVQTATQEFQDTNDVPRMFVEERCIIGPGHTATATALYEEYKFWCEDNGHKPKSSTALRKDWDRLGYERQRTNRGSDYHGLRLRGPHE